MTVTHTSDWRAYLPQKSHFLHKSNKRPLICDMWEKVTLIYGMTLARLDDFCKENVDRHWLRREATKKMTFILTQYLNIICFKRIISVAQSSQVGFVLMQQLFGKFPPIESMGRNIWAIKCGVIKWTINAKCTFHIQTTSATEAAVVVIGMKFGML